jgi:hypothetical protein
VSSAKRCDVCRGFSKLGTSGWFKLSTTDSRNELDVCSLYCLADYVKKQHQLQTRQRALAAIDEVV